MQGVVKKVVIEKGFGFIKPTDGGRDIFFHANDLEESMVFADLKGGETVEFQTFETPKGVKAIEISLVEV